MVRAVLRTVLIVIVVVAVGAFFFGYRWAGQDAPAQPAVERPIGTAGDAPIDTSRARETGAAIGEKVAVGANKAEKAVADASVTTKIKAKMALDDSVKALNIDVDTTGSVVTLTGRVSSEHERRRALLLARETEGVTSVVDHLTIAP
jgi:osmotically-inducible protein OsmY